MRQILKQTSWLVLAQGLTRVIGFFYTIFLANNLGVSGFGLFTVALAYFSILSSFADFGFNRFLVREVARDNLKTSDLLINVAVLRITFSLMIILVFYFFLYSFDQDQNRVSLVLLGSLAVLPQSIGLTFDSIFVAFKKLQFSATGLIISSFSTVLVGLFLVTRQFGPTGAVEALVFGQLIYGAVLVVLLFTNKGLLISRIKFSVIKQALMGSLPYGLLGILGLLYFRIDAIILSYMKGSFETGIYGIAYRFLEAIIFIPSAFGVVLFPNLAKLHNTNISDLKRIYFQSIKLMAIIGVIIMLTYILVLPEIIKLFLPQFLSSIDAIIILSLSIPFIFAATPGVQVLFSAEKYLKQVIFFSIFTVLFNITLNLLFIPEFGFLAAAFITVASDILSFIIFYVFITRKIFKNET